MAISESIRLIRDRIAAAARKAGRSASEIRLVAVSKTKPSAMIREAFDTGLRAFGENYAQELASKEKELADLPIEWHFIGHLQKNKARLVAPIAACVQTIDSAELAEALSRRATTPIRCLIEVNVGGEASKSGVEPASVADLARAVMALPNLELCGLMAIPPFDPDPEKSRPHFRKLKEIFDGLNSSLKIPEPLKELSMGMSHDFEVAIEEGATILRVGTAIFGER